MPTDLTPGALVQGPKAGYLLKHVLGEGGFGTTWLAERQPDGLPCALKSLHLHRLKEWKSWELFQREAAVLRRLSHPRIPAYIDDFALGDDPKSPDGLVLVQQFVAGAPLSEVVAGERSTDEGAIVSWMVQILDVLAYLHSLSPPVIHRDVTPKNILVGDDGAAWLVDFGTVQAALRSASDISSTAAGTFGYAPMEQFVGGAFPQSDLYGLAMTVLAVGSGIEPTEMSFSGLRVDCRKLVQFDARLMLLLDRMTEPDPERRLGDARVALEQLRPLVSRLSSDRVGAGAALQQVAKIYRKERAKPTRAATGNDDLLPSERIAEAGVTLALLGAQTLAIPAFDDLLSRAKSQVISASGRFVALQNQLLDTSTMGPVASLPHKHHAIAMDPSAQWVVARNENAWTRSNLHIYQRAGRRYNAVASIDLEESGAVAAISPDGRTICLAVGEGPALLYDAATGRQTQKLAGRWTSALFTPDGSGVVMVDTGRYRVKFLFNDGFERQFKESTSVACSPDGRSVAVFGEPGVTILTIDELRDGRRGKRFGPKDTTWRAAAFSPDGLRLAANNYSDDVMLVMDPHDRKVLATLCDPTKPDKKLRRVNAVGFSTDGGRLFIACDTHFSRFSDEDEECVGVWSQPEHHYLGAALLNDKENRVMLVSASGFYGSNRPSTSKAKSKRDGDGWERPDVAREALLGQPVDAQLDEIGRAQLADLEARWVFAHELKTSGRVEPDAGLAAIVDVTRGLTHVLDRVVQDAREVQAATPTFGGGGASTALTVDHLQHAADALRARDPAELSVIHEHLVASAEAAEAARAGVSPRSAPNPPRPERRTPNRRAPSVGGPESRATTRGPSGAAPLAAPASRQPQAGAELVGGSALSRLSPTQKKALGAVVAVVAGLLLALLVTL